LFFFLLAILGLELRALCLQASILYCLSHTSSLQMSFLKGGKKLNEVASIRGKKMKHMKKNIINVKFIAHFKFSPARYLFISFLL
jgi:hypothetical protein